MAGRSADPGGTRGRHSLPGRGHGGAGRYRRGLARVDRSPAAEFFLDRRNETLTAPPEFMLVISFNPGYQRNFKELKPSTRQRFVGLSFHYPAPPIEAEIVAHESGVELAMARRLVTFANKVRHLQDSASRPLRRHACSSMPDSSCGPACRPEPPATLVSSNP